MRDDTPPRWRSDKLTKDARNSLETWDPIPVDKRDSREVIQAAGDAYFNRFANASFVVPFGTPCARLEGGAYTDPRAYGNNTCGLGLPSTIKVTNRRYVVDEEMGAVAIYLGVTEHKQCKWTSCSEGCPAGWIRMMRKDPGARTNEYMTNEAGCNGVGKQYVPSSPASSFALDPSLSWNNVSIC